MKTHVIYHRADFDGLFCREIANQFFQGNAELIGWDYGDPEPMIPEEDLLYILDLSVPGLMQHPKLIWIDHHRSAIEKYPHTIAGLRIDGVAACRLAWQFFYGDPAATKDAYVERQVKEPIAVRLAGEYDVWDKRDPDAELFQHGLRSQSLDSVWEVLLQNPTPESDGKRGLDAIMVEGLLDAGLALQYAQTRSNESIIKEIGFTFEWEGLTFLACNAARYNSLLFTAGLRPEHDGCFGFKYDGKGGWSVSLYGVPGKPDVDLAAIAVKHGGGGHKQACGFRTATLPFLAPAPKSYTCWLCERQKPGTPAYVSHAISGEFHYCPECWSKREATISSQC